MNLRHKVFPSQLFVMLPRIFTFAISTHQLKIIPLIAIKPHLALYIAIYLAWGKLGYVEKYWSQLKVRRNRNLCLEGDN